MKTQDSQHKPEQQPARTDKDSPLNRVKLELGMAIMFGIIIWLLVDVITPSITKQLALLACYGFIAAVWLIFRTRQILKHHQSASG